MPDEILFTEEPRLYWLAGQPYQSVTGILAAAGIKPDFSHVPKARMQHAIARGNAVHHGTHLIDLDTLDASTVDPQIDGYLDAYRRFRRECRIDLIARELKMVSRIGFGMRPDIVAWVCGRRSIVDLKTAQNLGKSTGPQTGGYLIGWNSQHALQHIEDRYGLRLQSNGYYKLIPYTDPDDILCFMDCLTWAKKPTPENEAKLQKWRNKYV